MADTSFKGRNQSHQSWNTTFYHFLITNTVPLKSKPRLIAITSLSESRNRDGVCGLAVRNKTEDICIFLGKVFALIG